MVQVWPLSWLRHRRFARSDRVSGAGIIQMGCTWALSLHPILGAWVVAGTTPPPFHSDLSYQAIGQRSMPAEKQLQQTEGPPHLSGTAKPICFDHGQSLVGIGMRHWL